MGQAVAATDTIETDTLQSDTDDGNNSRNDGREPDKSYLAARILGRLRRPHRLPRRHLRFGRRACRKTAASGRTPTSRR